MTVVRTTGRQEATLISLVPTDRGWGGGNFNLFSNSCDQIPGKKQLKREGLLLALVKKGQGTWQMV